jgi:hypothetical protein
VVKSWSNTSRYAQQLIGLELTNQGLDFPCSFGDHYPHDVIEGAHDKLFGSWRNLERRVILLFDTGL